MKNFLIDLHRVNDKKSTDTNTDIKPLSHHINNITTQLAQNNDKKLHNVAHYVQHLINASKDTLIKIDRDCNTDHDVYSSLDNIEKKYTAYYANIDESNINRKHVKYFNNVNKDIKKVLVDYVLKSEKYNKSFIKTMFLKSKLRKKISMKLNKSVITLMNHKEASSGSLDYSWQQIDHTFKLDNKVFRSIQTPANELLNNHGQLFENIAYIGNVKYADGEGVSSVDNKNLAHITTGFQSEFFMNNKKLFSGIRHGVVDSYAIKDKKLRKEASKNKALEVISLALASKPNIFNEALKLTDISEIDTVSDKAIPKIHLTSTSLLTASYVSKKEKIMQKFQNEAFQELLEENNGVVNIPITLKNGKKKNIRIKVDLTEFYVPVNFGGVGPLSYFSSNRQRQQEVNTRGFNTLLTRSEQRIKELQDFKAGWVYDPEKRSNMEYDNDILKIKLLRTELADILENKKHNTQRADTYKLPARILALTSLINEVPLFNCKSGKDRTSMAYTAVGELCAILEEKVNLISSLNKIAEDDIVGVDKFIDSLDLHNLNLLNQLHTRYFERNEKDHFIKHNFKKIRKNIKDRMTVLQNQGNQEFKTNFQGKKTKTIKGLDDYTKEIFSMIAINNGNLEIQQNNTVLPGYKVRGVEITKYRPITETARDQILRFSKFT